MSEKYFKVINLDDEIDEDALAMADAFMEIFGFKRVKTEKKEPKSPIPTNISYYEGRIARRMHWDENEKRKFFGNMLIINDNSYISMLLKEISRKMYGEECIIVENPNQDVYVISLDSLMIGKLPYNTFHNPRHMALFKTFEDAELAMNIVKEKFEIHE